MTTDIEGEKKISLLFVGDLFLGGEFNLLPEIGDYGYKDPFLEVEPLFSTADIRFGNLESPLGSQGRMREGKGSILTASPEAIEALSFLGFDLLSLGNNHSMDFGWEGMQSTMSMLAAQGIDHVGAGRNLEHARTPRILERNDLGVAFLAYTIDAAHVNAVLATETSPGCTPFRWEIIEEDLERTVQANDLVCVSVHWGHEYARYPSPGQVALAHRMIDHGARIVIGHHPHVVQGFERYADGVIFYSLGNFFFPDYRYQDGLRHAWPEQSLTSLIATCSVGTGGVLERVEVIPCRQTQGQRLKLLDGAKGDPFLERVAEWSRTLQSEDYEAFWSGYLLEIQRYLEAREAGKMLQALRRQFREGGLRSILRRISLRRLKHFLLGLLRVLRSSLRSPGRGS